MVMSWGPGWSCFPFPPNLLPVLAPRLPVSLTFYIHKSEFYICFLMSLAVWRRADGSLTLFVLKMEFTFFFKKKGGQDFCCNAHHWSMVSLFQQGNTNQAVRWPPHHMTAQPIRGQAEEPGRHSNKRRSHQPIAALQFWIMTDPFSNYENTKRGSASFISQQTIKTLRLTRMEKCRSSSG